MNDEQTPALREAVENMANMREAYDNLSQAAEAYNTGKTELAQNITAKGVAASASETLPELAGKVNAIAQESYTIDGGEMYAKQLFGSLETPNYWNLYEVLANLLSDGRLVSYGGILLAEYYRGYDSLALAGAGAGGAYVVSDKDSQGNFIMYTNDTTHVWDTAFDGKGNRWVAYCFADEYHDFQITDTNTSPRSIFIGRKVGTITSLVNGRVSQIVVPDGNELVSFNSVGYTQNFGKNITLRVESITGDLPLGLTAQTECGYIECDSITVNRLINNGGTWIINANSITHTSSNGFFRGGSVNLAILRADEINGMIMRECSMFNGVFIAEEIKQYSSIYKNFFSQINSLYLGYITNDRTKSVLISSSVAQTTRKVEIQEGWCKPLDISIFTGLLEEDIVNNILNKLGDNTDQSPLTITLGATNLAKLTAEEIAIATNKGFTLA